MSKIVQLFAHFCATFALFSVTFQRLTVAFQIFNYSKSAEFCQLQAAFLVFLQLNSLFQKWVLVFSPTAGIIL